MSILEFIIFTIQILYFCSFNSENLDCEPSTSIPILIIHGTLDPLFPWNGGVYSSVTKTLDTWLTNNQCNFDTKTEQDIAIGIHETKWENDCFVRLVKIYGGFHAWPPQRMNPEEYIWNFFKESN